MARPKLSKSYYYWRDREQANSRKYLKEEAAYARQLSQYYDYAMDQIQKEIDRFYSKYARDEGIDLAAAKQKVSQLDIDEYSRKAKQYVKTRDFSDAANAEMRLYNLTMKVNRLEMLKAKIGLETVAAASDSEKYLKKLLEGRSLDEIERQAGILGKSVGTNAKQVQSLVNASFHNATWSDTIWKNQNLLRDEISKLLTNGLIQGKSSRELAQGIQKAIGAEKYNAERLMRTELNRVQIAAQLEAIKKNGFDRYMYITLSSAGMNKGPVCDKCKPLDGKDYAIDKAEVGKNLPPMHPNCRCSIAAYEDSKEYEDWLDEISKSSSSPENVEACENFDQLENLFKSKYGIDMADDVKVLDFKRTKLAAQGIQEAIDLFPECAKQITQLDAYPAGLMSSDGKSIFFNPEYFSKKASNQFADGLYFQAGAHEVGHCIDMVLCKRKLIAEQGDQVRSRGYTEALIYRFAKADYWDSAVVSKGIVADAVKKLKKLPEFKGYSSSEIRRTLSEYSRKNTAETLAEAVGFYTEMQRSKNPRKITKEAQIIAETIVGSLRNELRTTVRYDSIKRKKITIKL